MTRRRPDHLGLLVVILLGVLAMFLAVIWIATYVSGKEQARRIDAERAAARTSVKACERNAQNVVNDLNMWHSVYKADYLVGNDPSPQTSSRNAAIRKLESEEIDDEATDRATRLDIKFAKELKSVQWRAAAKKAHFTCTAAFPLPKK